ncbi:hypothetical protein CTEN210_00321 [Chaetoceros tenuissimus]|uniref:Leucine-rich repeat domain-containing protein n=1 Tax=Chaetoceros tenuissimus TaxID=426638 RepID=A0AAD3GYV0_9STRA|nr:hypothetical protein CTEN210_00321 [Chaetoceros tenuissimus]
MRVATVDSLVTLFYDGSRELFDQELIWEWEDEEVQIRHQNNINGDWEDWQLEEVVNFEELNELSDECKRYIRERRSWQQIIVVDGVTEIPDYTFYECYNIQRVIFADSVIRIEHHAFFGCRSLFDIKWPLNLECIGQYAFRECNLSSVFIPPRCREIGGWAFVANENLTILNIPQDTELQRSAIFNTKLFQKSPAGNFGVPTWLKNMNNSDQFALHRVCSSFEPTLEMIVDVLKDRGGPNAFKVENSIGITPSRYLQENPYAHIIEKEIIEKYILDMMGEL